MKDKLKLWMNKPYFSLAEVALLINEQHPNDWTDDALISKPPNGFLHYFNWLRRDASTVLNDAVQSEEYEGEWYTEYALMTNKFKRFESLNETEWLSVGVDKSEVIKWLKTNNIKSNFFSDELNKAFNSNSSKSKSSTINSDFGEEKLSIQSQGGAKKS